MRKILFIIANLLSPMGLLVAANVHAQRELGMSVFMVLNSTHDLEVFRLLSPCIILLVTSVAYVRYIVDYTGVIATWSFIGFVSAFVCCLMLLEAPPNDWTAHILWVYVLFISYIWWDGVMLLWLLPSVGNHEMTRDDEEEIYHITSIVNWPTLGALLLIWFFAKHLSAAGQRATASCYVDGVVAFHLVFSSVLAAMNMQLAPTKR